MTKEELAAELNGRRYGDEVPMQLEEAAKSNNLVIVFSASDDLMEFRGAIEDEFGCWGGGTVRLDKRGLLPSFDSLDGESEEVYEDYFSRKKYARPIQALWSDDKPPCWTYKTDIPHAVFDIVDGDTPYCRGIVFSLADVEAI